MKKKLLYESPDVEVIELKLDATVMQGSLTEGEPGEKNSYNSYDEDF